MIKEYSLKLFDSIVLLKIVPQLFLYWCEKNNPEQSACHLSFVLILAVNKGKVWSDVDTFFML